MTDYEVMECKGFTKDKTILCCETFLGDRFRIKKISFKDAVVLVEMINEINCHPQSLKEIRRFKNGEIKAIQGYLLNKEVGNDGMSKMQIN